jgi:precorrin-4 methylase
VKAIAVIIALAAGALSLAATQPLAAADPAGTAPSGRLYLVGMGPGAPDLATVRATRVVKSADHVFCFGYLTEVLTPLARPGAVEQLPGFLAKRFYGTNRRHLPHSQKKKAAEAQKRFGAFGAKVRKLVAAGNTVAIVDGGDPLIFGAWSWVTEEFDDLPLEIVPGLSSFNAANAALKRDVMWGGRRCVVLSGGDVLGVPCRDGRMTTPTVFFTHRAPIDDLVPRLLKQYPADTPVAVVSQAGCGEKQEIVRATLETILNRLGEEGPGSPYLFYVGEILTLKHKD